MNDATYFEINKYLIVKNALAREFCDILVNYAKFQALYDFTPESEEVAQVSGTHSRYADFMMESILLHLKPLIEDKIKKSLLPTYSYYRLYKEGDALEPHVDRPACEVSATLALGWPKCEPWPFKLSNQKNYENGTKDCHTPSEEKDTIIVNLEPGDLLIYAGQKVKHWRDSLSTIAYVQAFFHYVYKDGQNTQFEYDGRGAIGVPRISDNFEYVKYSEWMKSLLQLIKDKNAR